MSAIGCRIRTDFPRPPRELVELFRGVPVANIDDCMNRMAAIDAAIRPLNAAPLLGTAFTVKVAEGDNLMFHKAMDMAQPGDVFMIDAGGCTERSIFGELMLTYCKVRGVAGVVVDGAVRDAGAIAGMDLPVYARGVTPNGPYKNGPGEINYPISLGGVIVNPGDIVVGDADSVLVIRPGEAGDLAKAARAVVEKEASIMAGILKGEYSRPWVDAKLRELGCAVE